MSRILARLRRLTCRHAERRVWDLRPEPGGGFLLRLYCPRCGQRWDARQGVEDYIRSASSEEVMADTLRRNLHPEAARADEENGPPRPAPAD